MTRFDVRGVGARADARNELLRALNRLRPDVVLELHPNVLLKRMGKAPLPAGPQGPLPWGLPRRASKPENWLGTKAAAAAADDMAREWVARWHLSAPWIEAWASLVARTPPDWWRPFFDSALTVFDAESMAPFDPAPGPDDVELFDAIEREAGFLDSEGYEERQIIIDGPNPLRESLEDFMARAKKACDLSWDVAVERVEEADKQAWVASGRPWAGDDGGAVALAQQRGYSFDMHLEWFIRYQVCGESVAQLLSLTKGDVSTAHKALRAIARRVGIRLRPGRGRAAK